MPFAPKFKAGDFVIKETGAKFGGKIVGDPYLTEGPTGNKWHYNVCAIHPLFLGTTHIMIESQIRLMGRAEQEMYTGPLA